MSWYNHNNGVFFCNLAPTLSLTVCQSHGSSTMWCAKFNDRRIPGTFASFEEAAQAATDVARRHLTTALNALDVVPLERPGFIRETWGQVVRVTRRHESTCKRLASRGQHPLPIERGEDGQITIAPEVFEAWQVAETERRRTALNEIRPSGSPAGRKLGAYTGTAGKSAIAKRGGKLL